MAHRINTIFSFENEYETLVEFSNNDVTLPTDNHWSKNDISYMYRVPDMFYYITYISVTS